MGRLKFRLGVAVGLLLTTIVLSDRSIAQTPSPSIPTVPAPVVESPFDLPKSIPTVSPDAIPSPEAPTQTLPTTLPTEQPIRLVVQRGKRRVLVYRGKTVLGKYPIAVGKKGWETPIGEFTVLSKEENPTFKSFKTGAIIEPGPDNPLGVRWIGIWTDGKTQLGFHGTDQPELIGQAVSHGCIRMHNKDVVALYNYVQLGTTVIVEK